MAPAARANFFSMAGRVVLCGGSVLVGVLLSRLSRRLSACAQTTQTRGSTSRAIAAPSEDFVDSSTIPFSVYAACRLLGLTPDKVTNHGLCHEVRVIAKNFLKADRPELESSFETGQVGQLAHEICTEEVVIEALHHEEGTAPVQQTVKLHQADLKRLFFHELEAILFDYLAEGWDKVEQVVALNEKDLKDIEVEEQAPADSGKSVLMWQRAKLALTAKSAQEQLKTTRKIRTMLDIFKEVDPGAPSDDGAEEIDSLRSQSMPAGKAKPPVKRPPVLLMLGGGMAAGKSTVRELIGHSDFWSKVGRDAVIVEADAIKNEDKLYNELKQLGGGKHDFKVDVYMHDFATKAAENKLVVAINAQKDVVFDGTHVWAPFVNQTIAMVRDHPHTYAQGPGYQKLDDGSVVEEYWKPLEEEDASTTPVVSGKRPYNIEFMGVSCHPALAVARGVWRKLRTGRSVPVASQLRSHKMFAKNWENTASRVDSATLYHTGMHLTTFYLDNDGPAPRVIAHKSSATGQALLVDPGAYDQFRRLGEISENVTGQSQMDLKPLNLRDALAPAERSHLQVLLNALHKKAGELVSASS